MPPFLSGLEITLLSTVFYLCLTIMLGTIFNHWGAVLGIALGSVLGESLLASVFKPLLYVTPWILPTYAFLLANGQPISAQPGYATLISTTVLMIIMVLVSLVIFQKSEY